MPYLVTSKGDLLVVKNIVRNGSLWSNVVFEKEEMHITSGDNGVFIFPYYLATSKTNWAQIFTGLLF